MQSSTTVCILSTVAECSGCVVRSGGVPVAAPTHALGAAPGAPVIYE